MVTRDQKWVELAGIKTKMAGVLRSSLRCLPSISLRRSIVARLSSTSEKEVALQTKEEKDIVEQVTPNELVSVNSISGVPEELKRTRVVRIYKPARNAMQSGTNNINHWNLEFDTQERWENPLMGWASSADPLSNLSLTFDTVDEAIAYVTRNGWKYEIQWPKVTEKRPKSYAANFSWDKKTRIVTK